MTAVQGESEEGAPFLPAPPACGSVLGLCLFKQMPEPPPSFHCPADAQAWEVGGQRSEVSAPLSPARAMDAL